MSDPDPAPRERWRRADEILDLALDAPPSERAALVADACGSDAQLKREVESLLKADEQAGRFLEPALEATDPEGPLLNASAPLARGTVLAARYRIDEPIGRGGMGLVYRARDLVLQTDVAVKVLDPDVVARPGRLEAFRREVRLARLVTHPNVCRVHDIVEDGALTFITMEHVVGESLAQRLERAGPPSREWCRRVLDDVLRGLAAAHAAKVIHRDLKPGNVMLRDGTDEAVVADFGVAAEAAGADSSAAVRAGTRGYMAPEQASGAAPDVRSDLFSFGVLAHRVATGGMPGEEPARAVPSELAGLVSACLRTDPGQRPASADVALAMLGDAGARRGRRLAAAAIVAVLSALLGIAAWSRAHRPVSQPPAELLVAAVDTSQLDAREAWLGEALRHLIVNDLIDAWSLDARVAPNTSVAPEATIRSRLWRDAAGRLRASLTLPGERRAREGPGGSLRDVAEQASRRIVEATVPAAARHPTPRELREVCASDPEAWRQFRRARRAARMQQWLHVGRMAGDAVARDPGFCMAWLELDLSHNAENQARRPLLDKVVALGDAAQELSPLSRLGVDYARYSRAGDDAGVGRVLQGLAALKLEGQDLLYVKTRLALAPFAGGAPEAGLPLLERIAEEWPQDAAAPKKLAEYYLGQDEPALLPLALRYGRTAVEMAPEDVAARANLARTLVLSGDEAAGREQAAVLAMADPDEKQGALLFGLHLALGDVEEAAADARRLQTEPGFPHGRGEAALAAVALARGDFEGGLARLEAAAREYERLQVDAFARLTRWQQAWHSYALGRPVPAAAAPDDSLSGRYARCTAIIGTLARMREGRAAQDPAAVASLRREIARLPAEREWMVERATFELLLRYTRKDWAGVVAAYHDLERRIVPLGTAYYAADALERLGRREEAARVYEQLATHPNAWRQPYRRGQAWLRLGILRQQAGDAEGARRAFESLLRLWDRAPRVQPEIAEAERRLKALTRSPAGSGATLAP